MEIYVGDRVQIKNNGLDITNGSRAKQGLRYGEGGPLWATVVLIDTNWYTEGKYGLPDYVTKIRCQSDNGIIVWQVRPEDIASNIIRVDNTAISEKRKTENSMIDNYKDNRSTDYDTSTIRSVVDVSSNQEELSTNGAIVTHQDSQDWNNGVTSYRQTSETLVDTMGLNPDKSYTTTMGIKEPVTYPNSKGGFRTLTRKERRVIGSGSIEVDSSALQGSVQRNSWANPEKRREMLNENPDKIQNGEKFPSLYRSSRGLMAAQYDYQIVPGDPKFPKMVSLEDKLQSARASMGIQIHGSNEIGKAVKYYMYNRFKVPDPNLAYSKTITHIFFTRPDLNLLTHIESGGCRPVSQVINHSQSSMIWKKNPELFKLLTDSKRCGDDNNFNLLMSNQITSFNIKDGNLKTEEVGKSWIGHSVSYGRMFDGNLGGEIACNFNETSNLALINLFTLWTTYIDNVSNGAWSPSYNLFGSGGVSNSINASHVYTKTLDYGASAYVFVCGPDGEDLLYWIKYYGIFPINTGADALSWELGDTSGDSGKLNITFKYSSKKVLSPISLIEFNNNARISPNEPMYSENAFNVNYAHTSRPFVGCPYIEFNLGNPTLIRNGVNTTNQTSHIRLKFKKTSDSNLTDRVLYRYNINKSDMEIKLDNSAYFK